jgi:hypothetical protein
MKTNSNRPLGGWGIWRLKVCNGFMADEEHLVPVDDYRPHILAELCWCKPLEFLPQHWLHHALDQREEYEQGRMLH